MLSDSDDDSALLGENPLGTSAASRNNNDDDDELQKAIEASKATFVAEENRRQSLGLNSTEQLSDEEFLDILPPSKPVKTANDGKPRLSYSGAKPEAPLMLDDDSDDDDSDIETSLADRFHKKKVPVKKETTECSIVGKQQMLSIDHPDSSPKRSDDAKPAAQKMPPTSSAFDQTSSSDSEDSLAAFKKTLATRRKLVVGQYSSDDSDSEDDDISSSLKRRETTRRAVPSKPAGKKKATARRMNSAADKAAEKEQKEREKLERAQRRKQEKAERDAAKQREKEERAAQRQRERAERLVAKEAEKESKKRQREEAAQTTGKYCTQEIAVLLERDLLQHARLTVVDDLQEAGYRVQEYPSALGCKAIQWIRKDYLQGGAADALQMLRVNNKDGYQHLPLLTIVCDVPHEFIQMLQRTHHDEEDDYPEMETWLRGIEAGWRAAWRAQPNEQPRIILLLYQVKETLDKLWVNYRRRARKDDPVPPTAEEMHDALTWMLIQFQVECIHCESLEDVSHEVTKMTRLLAEEPYQGQVTELECVKKLKAGCSDTDPAYERAKDCWLRQVQQLPRVSHAMARNFVEHYPTARSLWLAYQNDDLTEDEKRVLVSDCFSNREQVKLSNWMYTIMTTNDPSQLLR